MLEKKENSSPEGKPAQQNESLPPSASAEKDFIDSVLAAIGIFSFICLVMLLLYKPVMEMRYTRSGNYYIEKGDISAAIYELNKAIKINPRSAGAHANLGIAYYNQKKINEAIAELEKSVKIDGENARTNYYLGLSYYEQGKLSEAVNVFEKSVKLDRKAADAHFALGKSYYDQGKLKEAILRYRETIRLNPAHAGAHNGLGLVYFDRGKNEAAIAEFERALKISPNNLETRYNLGLAYNNQGRLLEATEQFKEVIKTDFNNSKAHYNLGNIYYKQDKFAEAVIEYSEYLELDYNNALVHYKLGTSLYNTGQVRQAIEEYQKAVRIDSTYRDILAPALGSAEKILTVIGNMTTFQAVVETFANSFDGHYPKDLNALYTDASRKNYWKEIRNPYTNQLNIHSICLDYQAYKKMKNKDKLKGIILYEPAGEAIRVKNMTGFLSYKIYGTDEKGQLIRDGAKIATLSNN